MGLILLACDLADDRAGARSEGPASEPREPGVAPSAAAKPAAPATTAHPPAEKPPSPGFVGRWAADERLCASKAWRFTERMLRTPAGSVCNFAEVTAVPGGYDIKAHCTAEATQQQDVIELRFAQSAGAMLFDSKTIAAVGLIRCGA